MTFDYTRSRATAERLIARFGKSATLRQITNFNKAWAPVQHAEDATITVVDLNERVRDNSGTLIGRSQRTMLVSTAAGVTPGKGDKVAVGLTRGAFAALAPDDQAARLHEVVEVRPLSPGGTIILWEVDLAT